MSVSLFANRPTEDRQTGNLRSCDVMASDYRWGQRVCDSVFVLRYQLPFRNTARTGKTVKNTLLELDQPGFGWAHLDLS